MLVEKRLSEALKDFAVGRKVRVIQEHDDGSANIECLEDILPEEGCHYLVDVPAYDSSKFGNVVHRDPQTSADNEPVEEPKGFGGGYP